MEGLHSALSKGILRCGFLIAFTSALVCGQGVISTVAGSGNANAAGDGGPQRDRR